MRNSKPTRFDCRQQAGQALTKETNDVRRTLPGLRRQGVAWLVAALGGLLAGGGAACGAPEASLEHIQQIDLIHFAHTDFGFTDHPAVCRDLQKRYLDVALDTTLATRRLP